MENNLKISSGAITDRGLSEKRPENQDAFLEIAQCGIYAVADGVGGAQAGEVASQMAVEILGEAFTNKAKDADAQVVMRTAFERANEAIYQMARELPQLASMATTVVALHLDGNIATIGHVGDSRLYRVDRDGTLHRETDDHSMVAEEVRAGRMTEEQAENHPSRNIISRALGAESEVSIDLKTMMVEPGTAFLICSDGITRHVADPEIKGVLTFGGTPDEICDYLKNLCYERGAEDNLTAVVIKTAGVGNAAAATAGSYADTEDATVATVRPQAAAPRADDDDGELLELETLQMDWPAAVAGATADQDTIEDLPDLLDEQETVETNFGTTPATFDLGPLVPPIEHAETRSEEEADPVVSADTAESVDASYHAESGQENDVTSESIGERQEDVERAEVAAPAMFGGTTVESEVQSGGGLGKMAVAAVMLIVGSLIGLGVYHFGIAPAPQPLSAGLPTMQSENIEFSSFEKTRRQVDADPDAYLKDLPPPDDAEDYYLTGRAYLLKGDFAQARAALIEAQKLLAASPQQANKKILATDISLALLIANDLTVQSKLRSQIDGTLGSAPASGSNPAR